MATVEVDAPPERVWEVISDPNNLPRWERHVIGVSGVPEPGLSEGDEYDTQIRALGVSAHVRAKVVVLDPPTRAELRLSGPIDATVGTTLTPLDGGSRTLLVQDVEYRIVGGAIGRLIGRMLKLLGAGAILRRGTTAQKIQVEELVRRGGTPDHAEPVPGDDTVDLEDAED